LCLPGVDGFGPGQQAPWINPALNPNLNVNKLNDIYIVLRPNKKSDSELGDFDSELLDELAEDVEDEDMSEVTSSQAELTSHYRYNDVSRPVSKASTIAPFCTESMTSRSNLRAFWTMARPSNFPGLLCFHFVGIMHALKPNGVATKTIIRLALKPAMLVTLLSLFLICSASMIVNDYYDGRTGVDSYDQPNLSYDSIAIERHHTNPKRNGDYKPLVSGEVTYPITKRFLSYLYAGILISVAFVPGPGARLSVVVASMLTFWYTQHLKPKTWLKNVSCAALIALAPYTSGSAAIHLLNQGGVNGIQSLSTAWMQMGRLTTSLFTGFMAREIMMDIADCEADKSANILTVPVKYGKRFASKAALGCMMITAGLATTAPLVQLIVSEFSVGSLIQNSGGGLAMFAAGWSVPALRRLCLALAPSVWLVSSAMKVQQTEGRDDVLLRRTVEGSKVCVLLLLASFL